MLTPKVLRENAWGKLKSAKSLLNDKRFDDASYIAGYAVELCLKARYCTRKGLTEFPADRATIRALGLDDVFTHKLDELLTLSQGEVFKKGSLQNIDWDAAMDWRETKRYDKVGSVTEAQATEQIKETEKLFIELILFEIVEKMVSFETSIAADLGPFCLFAVVHGVAPHRGWGLLMSAWWLDSHEKLKDVHERAAATLDNDLASMINSAERRHPQDSVVKGFHMLWRGQHAARLPQSHNVANNRFLPHGFLITSFPHPEPTAAH